MKVSSIPIASSRPQIRRMSQRELQEPQNTDSLEFPLSSSNRWPNTRQSQIAPDRNNLLRLHDRPSDLNNLWRPTERSLDSNNYVRPSQIPQERYNPWRPNQRLPIIFDNNNETKCFLSKGWLWFFGCVFCFILLIAIVGIVLGIVLPMSTSAPDSSATSKMIVVDPQTSITCTDTDHGSIEILNESISSEWTLYSYNYSATQTTSTLLFGFKTDSIHTYYLDAVSVVDTNASSIELLINSNFDNSTINATGWITSCELTCASQIISGSQCFQSSGNCFMSYCTANSSSISFLSQSFMTRIGNTYTISFMLKRSESSSTGSMSFYLDVI